MYDYVIVGGGPSGLTLATYLPGKVAVFERHPVLGGCHRTLPSPNFVEHGPRVYSGAYVNVQRVLRDIGTSWDALFQKIDFSPEKIDGKRWYSWLSAREISWLTADYMIFVMLDKQHGKKESMKTYCERREFSASSRKYIDKVCKFSDGAGADRYTLWEFLSGFDQHRLPFYVPKRTTAPLFAAWEAHLESRGVDIVKNANVTRVGRDFVRIGKKRVPARKVILCIPPIHAARLLKRSGIEEPGYREFAKKTKYDTYWSVSFYGDDLWDNAKGHVSTPWDIIAVQYPFGVLSAAAASPKTAGAKGVAKEIRRQLGLPPVKYDYLRTKYNDQAFVATKFGFRPAELRCGIASVGCHNGHSEYHFTSMESAVQNALAYLGMPRDTCLTYGDMIRWGVVIVLACSALAARRAF